jgi:hypothetical protein
MIECACAKPKNDELTVQRTLMRLVVLCSCDDSQLTADVSTADGVASLLSCSQDAVDQPAGEQTSRQVSHEPTTFHMY